MSALAYALLPQHALSWLALRLARSRLLAPLLKRAFVHAFQPDLAEADPQDPHAYATFASLFTRPLRSGARPLAGDDTTLVSPADGVLGLCGAVEGGALIQAKGRTYTLGALLGGDATLTAALRGGVYWTVYLAPRDYHRVHLPLAGTLRALHYLPGRLLPVKLSTVQSVDALYARNERAVCQFDTVAGPLAVVLVGALLVSGIETVWHGAVNPYGARRQRWMRDYGPGVAYARGAEIGRFNYGSTVVLVAPAGVTALPGLVPGSRVRMGQALGRVLSGNPEVLADVARVD